VTARGRYTYAMSLPHTTIAVQSSSDVHPSVMARAAPEGFTPRVPAGTARDRHTAMPAARASAARPSAVPGQCRRIASGPARRTTLRSTSTTRIASSA
jgi:hypothetical protein